MDEFPTNGAPTEPTPCRTPGIPATTTGVTGVMVQGGVADFEGARSAPSFARHRRENFGGFDPFYANL